MTSVTSVIQSMYSLQAYSLLPQDPDETLHNRVYLLTCLNQIILKNVHRDVKIFTTGLFPKLIIIIVSKYVHHWYTYVLFVFCCFWLVVFFAFYKTFHYKLTSNTLVLLWLKRIPKGQRMLSFILLIPDSCITSELWN